MSAPRQHAVPIPVRPGNQSTPDEIVEDSVGSWPRSWRTASECYSGSASRGTGGNFIDRVAQLRQRRSASPAHRPSPVDAHTETPSSPGMYTPFESPALASQGKPHASLTVTAASRCSTRKPVAPAPAIVHVSPHNVTRRLIPCHRRARRSTSSVAGTSRRPWQQHPAQRQQQQQQQQRYESRHQPAE
jgi:hypothetical protein